MNPSPQHPTGAGSDEHPVLDAEAAQFESEVRRIGAGGWRRATIGFALGSALGLLVALVLPRDEGPRRRIRPADRPQPFRDE